MKNKEYRMFRVRFGKKSFLVKVDAEQFYWFKETMKVVGLITFIICVKVVMGYLGMDDVR